MKNFLFDLDGTLTDPSEGITKSVSYALRKFGITVDDLNTLNTFIGPPLNESFKKYYGFSEEDASRGIQYYREYFSVTGIFENRLFPYVEDLLKALKKRGKFLIIATSKPEIYTVEILKHFGIYDYFDFVSGNTMSEDRSTKEAVIAHALESVRFDPSDSVMTGDRLFDINAGKHFGMFTVGAKFGFPIGDELEEAGADRIAETPEEMKNILLSL